MDFSVIDGFISQNSGYSPDQWVTWGALRRFVEVLKLVLSGDKTKVTEESKCPDCGGTPPAVGDMVEVDREAIRQSGIKDAPWARVPVLHHVDGSNSLCVKMDGEQYIVHRHNWRAISCDRAPDYRWLRARLNEPAASLSDEQIAHELEELGLAFKNRGEGGGSPGEWIVERMGELEHEQEKRAKSVDVKIGEEIHACHGLDTSERVRFYENEFYPLSNFSAFSVVWKGIRFATSEAVYHWEKFESNPDLRFSIENAPSAHEALKLAEEHKAERRSDWDKVKVGIMGQILREKFRQHEYVRRKLMETGSRELVEDSWRDDFWGWGPMHNGQNMMGKLWMTIRDEVRRGTGTNCNKPVPSKDPSLSPQSTEPAMAEIKAGRWKSVHSMTNELISLERDEIMQTFEDCLHQAGLPGQAIIVRLKALEAEQKRRSEVAYDMDLQRQLRETTTRLSNIVGTMNVIAILVGLPSGSDEHTVLTEVKKALGESSKSHVLVSTEEEMDAHESLEGAITKACEEAGYHFGIGEGCEVAARAAVHWFTSQGKVLCEPLRPEEIASRLIPIMNKHRDEALKSVSTYATEADTLRATSISKDDVLHWAELIAAEQRNKCRPLPSGATMWRREPLLTAIQTFAEEWAAGKNRTMSSPARCALYIALDRYDLDNTDKMKKLETRLVSMLPDPK
jgi:hypothetical protein